MLTSERQYNTEQLNEALSLENERLRERLESMVGLMGDFEQERSLLREKNDSKIDALEKKIETLMRQKSQTEDQMNKQMEETIRGLQDHVKVLESTKENGEGEKAEDGLKDEEWRAYVNRLEREVAETRDFYIQKIETLQKGQKLICDENEVQNPIQS